MAGKSNLIRAAIVVLKQKNEDVSYENVSEFIKKEHKTDISKPLFYSVKQKEEKRASAIPAATGEKRKPGRPPSVAVPQVVAPQPSVPTPRPGNHAVVSGVGAAVTLLKMARALVNAAGGDKDAVKELIEEV